MSIENRVFFKVQQKTFTLYSNVKMRPTNYFSGNPDEYFCSARFAEQGTFRPKIQIFQILDFASLTFSSSSPFKVVVGYLQRLDLAEFIMQTENAVRMP